GSCARTAATPVTTRGRRRAAASDVRDRSQLWRLACFGMPELGALVERYETSNRRRAVKAAIMMVTGVPLLAFGTFTLVIFMNGPAGSNMAIAGGILGLGLGLMIFAIVFAVQAVWRR